jgi:hypothetical protein
MPDPKVNNGIHGPLSFNPSLVKEIERERDRLMTIYPISNIEIHLSSIYDERWDGKKKEEKCKSCDISIAGYKTKAICEGCEENNE